MSRQKKVDFYRAPLRYISVLGKLGGSPTLHCGNRLSAINFNVPLNYRNLSLRNSNVLSGTHNNVSLWCCGGVGDWKISGMNAEWMWKWKCEKDVVGNYGRGSREIFTREAWGVKNKKVALAYFKIFFGKYNFLQILFFANKFFCK